MKVLWIVNTILNSLNEKLYNKKSNGLWMDALLESFKGQQEYQLVVATTLAINKTILVEDSGIRYYALPSQPPILYDENKKENISAWKKLLDEEKPDFIQVWGTEFTHGLCALRLAKDIPSVIYMQGYLGSIARHYTAGIPEKELKKTVTFRDILKQDSILQQQKKYYASTEKEKEMLELSGNIISENEWCNSSIRAIVPDIQIYTCPLSINKVFSEKQWDISKAEPHSVICTASGYPLKGLHMMLQAVAMLKKRYPDIKLYVPGTKMVSDGSLQWSLRKRGYTKYIEKLIAKLDIEKHVVWLGHLSQAQLAEQYEKTRVFVLSSSIENHSSSLKEAMMVGVPSIASAVGGVPEYVNHSQNGFLYRFEEYEIMAEYIATLFKDDAVSTRLSVAGRQDMLKLHENQNLFETVVKIYSQVMGER